jgi:hypothetical protein
MMGTREEEDEVACFQEEGGRDHDDMGMFASGMQKAIVLQQHAPAARRFSAIHLKHCTTKTEAKETSIIVDAATKVGPLRELIELVQQNAAAAMATLSVLPPTSTVSQPLVPWLAPSCRASCRRHSQWMRRRR